MDLNPSSSPSKPATMRPVFQQTFPITIDDIAFGGKGVGRLPDGMACFVPDVAPGERVFVELTKRTKRFAEGRVTGFSERSTRRVEPPCPYFGTCGGCAYQHLPYEDQLAIKSSQVAQMLKRLGGFENPNVLPAVGSPNQLGYRNRITVHVKRGRVGFFQRGGQKLVEIDRCLLASEPVNEWLAAWRKRDLDDGVKTIRENNAQTGFHQTNDGIADLLLQAVDQVFEQGGQRLIDAYCGSGFFAKRLAARFESVVGIEWNTLAVETARAAAAPNETYLAGDVAQQLEVAFAAAPDTSTQVILDPPAQGVSTGVCDVLLRHGPETIAYISCNPATLARDLKLLSAGYDLVSAQPFDMFAQTAEIEVLAVMRRRA